MLRIHSLRFRIALAYILGTLVVSGLVALGTFAITSSVLTRQTIEQAKAQTYDELTFLRDQLNLDDGSGKLRTYLQTLQQRGSDLIAKEEEIPAAEATSVGISESAIPIELRRGVENGNVGLATFSQGARRWLVFGSPVPNRTIYTYFFYSLESVDRTLGLLWRVLLGVVAVAGAVAGAVGLRLADRTIRPLRVAADAARRVAEGGLHTRLEVKGSDELGRLASDFNVMTEALEERIIRERQFISDVSHELRTPLTALKTSIDYIAVRVEELPQKLRSAVGLAAEEVGALRKLVDDLLELTRVDAGSVQISLTDIDLRNFASEIARRRAPDAHIDIEGPEELLVRTDKMRLERVVGNLVENAVVHGGGDDIRISLDVLNGAARIVVADQGPGIDAEQLPRIFERFWRGDAARSRDGAGGVGLGLAIALENARLIGADLQVESVAGEGTRFEVLLPREGEL